MGWQRRLRSPYFGPIEAHRLDRSDNDLFSTGRPFLRTSRERRSPKSACTKLRKRFGSLLELPECLSETLGGVGCCGEIVVGCRHLELLDLGVEADDIGITQGVQDTVPDVADGKDIPANCARVPRRRVERELGGPEIKAGEVDLGLRPVLRPEVQAPPHRGRRQLR